MVERVLEEHPAVAEVAVVGVPEPRTGARAFAPSWLCAGGTCVSEHELIDFCREKLGGFQRPRSVDFVAALPRTATGKVMRRALREPYWKDQRQRVGQA